MVQSSLFQNPENEKQQSKGITWMGQKVIRGEGPLEVLFEIIPHFERIPFEINGGVNPNLDVIFRSSLKKNQENIPVAVVSKGYLLVQHYEILEALNRAFSAKYQFVKELTGEVTLSKFGERMHFRTLLPEYEFNPGDGNLMGLQVHCFNSVDKSLALQIRIGWYRFVCSNGLFIGKEILNFRRKHIKITNEVFIKEVLNKQLSSIPFEENRLSIWLDTNFDPYLINRWANKYLKDKWGLFTMLRFLHIIQTGYDGKVVPIGFKSKEYSIRHYKKVPGLIIPVSNAFHISQVLSWLARKRNIIQEQLERLNDIQDLMTILLASD